MEQYKSITCPLKELINKLNFEYDSNHYRFLSILRTYPKLNDNHQTHPMSTDVPIYVDTVDVLLERIRFNQ